MTDLKYVDGHHAIIGASDAGKTWTAKFGVEELLRQKRHTLILDPLGVWYGLRSSADGTAPGFDIPIFGGPHGDVAIGADDGTAIAAIVADQRVSAIVDLSQLTSGIEQRRFVRALVARLRRRTQGNFHFVVDEADEFVPEKPRDDVAFALQEDMLWIAKKGRSSGWVQTLITQRTADLAKSALSQSQTIIAHQLIAPQDQKPFLDYVRTKGTRTELAEIEGRLASLQRGERYVYSPRRHVLELGSTPAIATFDSSRTPPPGQSRVEPRMLAELDVSAIAAALARPAPIDDTIPTDPSSAYAKGSVVGLAIAVREKQIAQLEADLADARAEIEHLRHVDAECDRYQRGLGALEDLLMAIRAGKLHPALGPPSRSIEQDRQQPAGATSVEGGVRGRKALAALARIYPAALTEAQWATMAGYTRTGGTWSTYKNALRAAQLVEQIDGRWRATDAGVSAAGEDPTPLPPPGPDLAREWARRVPGVPKMVEVLITRWPHMVTRDGLASDLGMTRGGGTFGTYLGRLRGNGLIEEQGSRLRLAAELMEPLP